MVEEARPLNNENLPVEMRAHWYNAVCFDPDDPWKDFEPSSAAVVLVDLINWQAHPDGASIQALRDGGSTAEADYIVGQCKSQLLPTLSQVLDAARSIGIRVIHARLAGETSAYDNVVLAMKPYVGAAAAVDGTWGAEVLEGLEAAGDLSVVKGGSGAFSTSDLHHVLQQHGIRTVLYAGVVTNACVMLTAAAGYDLGYRQYLLTDCTAALSERDHADAVRFMDAFIAQGVTGSEAILAFQTVGRRSI